MNLIFYFFVEIFMSNDTFYFQNLISEQLLIYVWNSLKFDSSYIKTFEPISKTWFSKCALLIRKGIFSYENLYESNKNFCYNKKNSLKLLKYKIIERAILNILILRLESFSSFEKLNSIEYVCLLFNNSFVKLIN